MDPTGRFWATAGAGALLAALGVIFARPELVVGAAAVGAILLARQYAFVQTLRGLDADLAVELVTDAQYVRRDGTTEVTLTVGVPSATPLPLAVTASLPVIAGSVDREARTVVLEPGDESGTATFELKWPVVGRATIPAPTVSVTDAFGLFTESFQRGREATVRVEPRQPQNVHVGEGGDAVSAAFGGHRADQRGQGTDPAELRQYVPGDSVSNIDWKATARLAYPHVREYEVETDRRTVLVVDHRGRLAEGPEGETKFDYLREVALTVAAAADSANDPLGLYAVGDDGLTLEEQPSTTSEHYRELRTLLHGLEPTEGSGTGAIATQGAVAARRAATTLTDDDTAFGRTLRPYFDRTEGYVRRMDDDPLFGTMRTYVDRLGSDHWVLLFTDDADRPRLRETIRLALANGNHVVCFLTPSVLFERGGLADLDDAYQRYADFESFRRELAALDRVTAYEVGPGERLSALLSDGRRR
ncbi:DUF58 domain-containing protein [Halosimplex salinum]|uniref:DUF58 domain-containing protein n=1 Tax=Halosimplex salinum TaxID=1710538 RepID=UPI000F475306|nr:DUF58 domain-containing protein [Halosimplex salinum]